MFVVSDDLGGAWDEMLEVRRAGADFAFMPLLDDPRSTIARVAASDVCAQVQDYDQRRTYMEGIERGDLDVGGRTALGRSLHEPDRIARLRQLLRLSTVLIVRSYNDLQRLRDALGPIRCNIVRWFPTRVLPAHRGVRKSEQIVVWGPEEPGPNAALAMFGLEQLHHEVTLVANTPPAFAIPFRYVSPNDEALHDVVGAAACVIDLSLSDPGWAHAFALQGIPVAAASTCGIEETVDGVTTYTPWSFLSIARAVGAALGRGPGRVLETAPNAELVRESLARAQISPPKREPLVSFVIPSYNRAARLERTVRELTGQQYAHIEILVVNDGGESLAHVGAIDPRIRVIDRTENVGVFKALNFGIREARGEYVEALADDDRVFPDHVLRLVAALERTGAAVAHTNTLLCVPTTDENGVEGIVYNTERFNETVDLSETYAYHRVARFMARRSVILELGGFAEDLFLADLDMLIRLAERFDFVHVPSITAETWLRGSNQLSTDPGTDHRDELKKMFERHPAHGRPYIAALREHLLEHL